jgi:predicted ribosome quality control (RQC) complex YloA/Tae2 family protein
LFDILTIAAIADELTERALDGRIQRIGLVDQRTIAAEIYAGGRRRTLVASASDQHARLLLTDADPAIDADLITPFSLLLRKHARGGVIVGIEQPPLERLVRISIAKRQRPHNQSKSSELKVADTQLVTSETDFDEDEEDEGLVDATFVHLYVEIMGRHSNLILVGDDGRIMESVKRVTPAMSRVRRVLPKLLYSLPPPLELPDPRRATTANIERLFAAEAPGADLAKTLVRKFRGMSPQMAREIVFQSLGTDEAAMSEADEDSPVALAREMRRLLEPLLTSAWTPCVYREDDVAVAFAPIPMAHLVAKYDEERVGSISAAATEVEEGGSGSGKAGRHRQRRERLAASVRDARGKAEAKLESLRIQADSAAEVEQWRAWGDLIYAYLWAIEPGQTELNADGVVIPLDPNLSAKENAQEYFERYRKSQSAGEQIPVLVESAEADLSYLDQLLTQIAQAETFPEIEALAGEWDSARGGSSSGGRKPRSAPVSKRPKALLDTRGNAIYIGRSGAQNDMVTFEIAGSDDTWLHARGVPGSHVIIRWLGTDEDDSPTTIECAASLAAYYSAARESGHVEVDVTRRRYVRKIKGTGPGMVTYRNERTISVVPRAEGDLGETLKGN